MMAGSIDLNSKDSLPDLASPAAVPGLSGEVELRRDTWGIPHIRAASHLDAFAGLGFAHAQDRLWQMEALLRRGTGRYAEWVGKSAVAADVLGRQLNTAGASQRDFALLNDETRAMLEAYARGVNAFIALGRWPAEYAILNAEPGAVGAVAFHRGDAPDRLSDGLGVVETMARGRIADRRRRPGCKIAVRRRRR